MEKGQMHNQLFTHTNENKDIVLEKIVFCKFADDYDFENYFRIEDLSESELVCLLSFLHHQDCYLMMLDVMSRCKERFAMQDESILEELDLSQQFVSRFKRLNVL